LKEAHQIEVLFLLGDKISQTINDEHRILALAALDKFVGTNPDHIDTLATLNSLGEIKIYHIGYEENFCVRLHQKAITFPLNSL